MAWRSGQGPHDARPKVRRRPGWPMALRAVITVTALGRWPRAATARSRRQRGLRPGHGDAAKIEAVDGDRFTPKSLELPAGEAVTIEITNADDRAHDFAIEAADLNTGTIQAGAVATATFTVPEGTTEFVCTFHRGMTDPGRLTKRRRLTNGRLDDGEIRWLGRPRAHCC